jgi:hypothetical protein
VRFQGKRMLLAILAAAAVGAVGCGIPPSRVEFIEKLAKENRDLARSTRAFRKAIMPLKDGNPASAAQVRAGYQEMETTLKEVRADVDAQMLPPASSSAKAFLDAYKAYLDGQQEILTTIMLPIVKEVEAPTDGAGPSWAVIDGLMKQVSAKENQTWAPLKQAQGAYTTEHNYQAGDLAGYIAAQKAGK